MRTEHTLNNPFTWLSAVYLLVILFVLTGCAAFNQDVAPRIADGVKHYCIEPQATRAAIRTEVNAMIAPNTIRVDCAGDVVSK